MPRGIRHQLRCTVCNMLFPACRSDALYCSDACAQQAHQRRQAAKALPAASGLEVREWHGTPIGRRADGYVNATAMCKANGKHLPHYMANDRTEAYIAALAPVVGIPTTALVESKQGGTPSLQGTWVHPRLAVDLARWISPAFAVWMDGWFLESITTAPTPHHHQTAYAVGDGITIHADSIEHARIIWRDAVWRHLTKVKPDDLFHCAQV